MAPIYYKLVKKSSNKKTGPIPLISTSQNTCPVTCPLRAAGCYGYSVPYLKSHWDKWSRGESGATQDDIEGLADLPEGTILRYGEVGDLPGDGVNIIRDDLLHLQNTFHINKLRAFTYTHYHSVSTANFQSAINNIKLIDVINSDSTARGTGLIINFSCEDLDIAKQVASTGRPATCTIPDDGQTDWSKNRVQKLGDGVIGLICPAVWREKTQCINCGGKNGPLCMRAKQKTPQPVILFPAHGPKKKQVNTTCGGDKV